MVQSDQNMRKENSPLVKLAACPVCASSSISAYKPANFFPDSLSPEDVKITDKAYGKVWALDRCISCTHVFANPCPTPEYIQNLYQDIVDPAYQDEAEGRQRNFGRILGFLEKIKPGKGHLFDVGAATGILLNLAQQQGWETEGIDPSTWAVKTAQARYGLDIIEGDFESAALVPDHYSAVTMVDFIEHVPDPLAALHKARLILKDTGILCLVTPDIKSLAARIAGPRWWHYRPAHLAYFTRQSLQALLARSGFQVLKIRRYVWTFSAHYLLTRLAPVRFLLKIPGSASFWRWIPIKLALGDSYEIYARK